jgi:CheY-like chemotaxis protein/HPt (histidine-containing phosphotransfer) domain-containing protein
VTAADGNLPRVLLVEDDAASLAFLTAAVQAVPAEVDTAATLADALALDDRRRHDLWLFDAHLPDGSGQELLGELRRRRGDVPALAHTASEDRQVLEALRAAGFDAVLVKPMPVATVQAAVRDRLGLPSTPRPAEPVWDDDTAASALNGNREHVATLRQLFTAELPHARERVARAARSGDVEALRSELHKLRASCGFVGATRLAGTVAALHERPTDAGVLADFEAAVEETGASWTGGQSGTD